MKARIKSSGAVGEIIGFYCPSSKKTVIFKNGLEVKIEEVDLIKESTNVSIEHWKDDRKRIYRKAFEKYGKEQQAGMLVDEIGELLSALNKYRRSRIDKSYVITKVADVRIMIEQLELMLDIQDDVEEEMESKIKRLEMRLSK